MILDRDCLRWLQRLSKLGAGKEMRLETFGKCYAIRNNAKCRGGDVSQRNNDYYPRDDDGWPLSITHPTLAICLENYARDNLKTGGDFSVISGTRL